MADDRRLKVLSAIVTDYVRTREPVGSRALVERYRLGVSPATIRNDMAALEDEGYIHQPHTSAGRVPTEKGYRLFVDEVARVKPLSAPERRAITALLSGAVDLEQVVAPPPPPPASSSARSPCPQGASWIHWSWSPCAPA
jgi:heat-inducible transcription repressor hrcA